MQGSKMIDLSNKKVLLVRNDNIGDLICTTPAIEALRKKYPSAQIDIVVNSYNEDAIKENPFINKTYIYTKPKHKKGLVEKIKAAFGKLKILVQIISEGYDAVVIFRGGYSKSAELFSTLSRAHYKIGVQNKNGKDGFTTHIIPNPNTHEVMFCFECLKPFGVIYAGEGTRYFIPAEMIQKYTPYQNAILFHISSRITENRYPKEKFKEIIDALKGKEVVISAEPVDFAQARWLAENTQAEFIKTSSLNDLGGLIANVKLFVTLDGGAMHLAPALGTKTIALSGKTNMNQWHPWGYAHLVLQDESKRAENISIATILKTIQENL